MKIAYLIHCSYGSESGVTKKILAQVNAWTEAGHVVGIFITNNDAKNERDWIEVLAGGELAIETFDTRVNHFAAKRRLAQRLLQWNPDVVYHRFGFYDPTLKVIARRTPMVMEINADDRVEVTLIGSWKHVIYNRLTRWLTIRACKGMVFVTNELSRSRSFSSYFGLRTTISNGINLRKHQSLLPSGSASPRLVFVGSNQPWQGIDKLVTLARLIPEWKFDIVGPQRETLGELPCNVSAHGRLPTERYRLILEQCDVGIGPLALHRKGLNEACPLKTREYLAFGLPVMIGYRESDFPQAVPFLLNVGNTENNIVDNMQRIMEFGRFWHGRRVDRANVSCIDLGEKERRRLFFLQNVLRPTAQQLL